MLSFIFTILYFLLIIGIALFGFFVVYHLKRYAINPVVCGTLMVVFVIVTVALIVINGVLFFTIPFDEFFSAPVRNF